MGATWWTHSCRSRDSRCALSLVDDAVKPTDAKGVHTCLTSVGFWTAVPAAAMSSRAGAGLVAAYKHLLKVVDCGNGVSKGCCGDGECAWLETSGNCPTDCEWLLTSANGTNEL